jgi:uncharacterized membrane protein
MKRLFLFAFTALSIAYPFLLYFSQEKISAQTLGLGLCLILIARAMFFGVRTYQSWVLIGFGLSLWAWAHFSKSSLPLMWYPFAVNITLLVVFFTSLFRPPPIVERMARLTQPSGETLPKYAVRYTRKVTEVWCGFFLLNALISAWTVCQQNIKIWTLYNGMVSYLLMGGLFVGEWLYRQHYRKRHEQSV